MKDLRPHVVLFLSLLILFPGCDLVKGIFQAGFWTAIILIVIVIALLIWAFYKLTGSNRKNTGR